MPLQRERGRSGWHWRLASVVDSVARRQALARCQCHQPLHDPLNDSEVPSYQVYLSLAWLRKEGIIAQHGRQGYSLPNETDIAAVVEERWQQLANR